MVELPTPGVGLLWPQRPLALEFGRPGSSVQRDGLRDRGPEETIFQQRVVTAISLDLDGAP